MQAFPSIHIAPLFEKLNNLLVDLLKGLNLNDWNRQTPAPLWTVKDVAAHLLDTNLRAISVLRDGYFNKPEVDLTINRELVDYLNYQNAVWVDAFKRVSPELLVEMLDISGKQFASVLEGLPPNEKAVFGVAWAGQEFSPNWLHVAREYSEKWHHQQQIRAALGCEDVLYESEFYFPFLQVSMYAIPYQYSLVVATEGESLKVSVLGNGGGDWFFQFIGGQWVFCGTAIQCPTCEVIIEGPWAWRIFMNAASREQALEHTFMKGKISLGLPLLSVRAVMV